MVYLVAVNTTSLNEGASPVRTLFLVKSREESLLSKHLSTLTDCHVDVKTMVKVKELPRVELEGTSIIRIGGAKPIMTLATEVVNVKEPVNNDTESDDVGTV